MLHCTQSVSALNSPRTSYLYSPFLVLDLGLDIVDGVGRLHLKGDRLPREGLDENLHLDRECEPKSAVSEI